MPTERYLIVNADDFGQSPGVNRGVVEAYERGVVTSASLMVRWPAAAAAADYGRERPDLSLGLHVDLWEWAYRDETWVPLYEVVPADDHAAVESEVARQLAAFRLLVGRDPTHLDSHQHAHRVEPAHSVLAEAARALGAPLRGFSPGVSYCGAFYGQTAKGAPLPEMITADALIRVLATLPPGVTELGCHPGLGSDLDTMYDGERAEEVRVLCESRVREAIAAEGIQLCSFHDVPNGRGAPGGPDGRNRIS